jgi:hypothetical protein
MIFAKPGIGSLEDWASLLVRQLEERFNAVEQSIQDAGISITDINNILTSYGTPVDYAPELFFGGNNVGMTFAFNDAQYIKIGCFVWVGGYVQLSAKGSSTGSATIALPFAATESAGLNNYPAGQMGYNVNLTWTSPPVFEVEPGLAEAYLYDHSTVIDNTKFANNTEFEFTITYLTSE